jgi:4-diphosphocytidyl-2-C-methyl-D-erythritol kinase
MTFFRNNGAAKEKIYTFADMITFPIAKINLGLNVVERRPDGYHNLETVFYPVPIEDALEVQLMDNQFPSDYDCDLKVTGITVEGDEQRNLVVRAYQLLKKDFPEQMKRICMGSAVSLAYDIVAD